MIIVSVALLGLSPILMLLAVGVLTAKGRSPLSFVDSAAMENPAAFNKRAGRRLMALPAAAFLLGIVGMQRPDLSMVCLVGFLLALLATVGWILVGAEPKR